MASSSSSIPSWQHDVFLSFRGEDTRRNFTDLLHNKLTDFGINSFMDDQLRRGEQISQALLQAIEDSRFSIIIFSQNYGSSNWCLDELTKILDRVHKGKHTAFPVFYEVDPSDVRKQRGSYEEAFNKHEEAYKNDEEKVRRWRDALTEASNYSGWDTRNQNLSKVIDEIAVKIFNEIPSSTIGHMVGKESHIKHMLTLLCLESPEVQMVGIWGMGGIGKTTIAEAIYHRLIHSEHQFQGCFLSNVREKSHRNENLQMELLSKILKEKKLDYKFVNLGSDSIRKVLQKKKVLIVLDDVDDRKQLDELAGDHDWFGPKSRIIITTRNKRLLDEKDINATHEVKGLHGNEALTLFCQHAFKDKPVEDDFKELCYRSLDYTKGNPLAIKILGSLLYKRSKKYWEGELEKLKKFPNQDVQKVLRISFDGLDDNEKEIFLDIACFFKGKDKDYILGLLESCDLHPETGITSLIERALITISDGNKLGMHDLIQEMGWEIVRQQSTKDPGKQSRLWLNEDVEKVLTSNRGTEQIQGIVFDLSTSNKLKFNVDVFKKMTNLRLLRFCNEGCNLHLEGEFKFISSNLRYLCWHKYPLKSLPSEFHPRKLFELNMSFSQLKELWVGYKSFPKLAYIDLSYCQVLIRTPDLSGALELRKLNLEACSNLIEVHPSIASLKNLIFLNLKGCSKLKELPESIGPLTSLQTLNLSGCSKLKKLPDNIGSLSRLVSLVVDGSGIQELPFSINRLTKIEEISMAGCKRRVSNPWNFALSLFSSTRKGFRLPSLSGLGSLKRLNLSDCNLLEGGLPSDMSSLCSLEYLNLSRNSFTTLPSLTRLTNLRTLKLKSCKRLQSLTKLPSSIQLVIAHDCESLETFSDPLKSYPSWVSKGAKLEFYNCQRLLENGQNANKGAIIPSMIATSKDRRYRRYSAIIAGSGIPEWFVHRDVGDSVIVKLPPDFDHTRPIGLAFCASFSDERTEMSTWHSLKYENIWIGYFSLPEVCYTFREDYLDIEYKGDDSGYYRHPSLSHLKFSFRSHFSNYNVKKCGIRLIYEPRPEDMMNEGTIECVTVAAVSCPPGRLLNTLLGRPCQDSRLRLDYPYDCDDFSLCVRGLYEFDREPSERAALNFYDCQRLLENGQNVNMGAIIPSMIATSKDRRYTKYCAIIPGSHIPEWFIHQNVGDSVIVKLPPDFDHTRPIGLAFCGSFSDYGINTNSSLRYESLWIGYSSLPPSYTKPKKCTFWGEYLDIRYKGDDSGYYEHPSISHLEFSFQSYSGTDIKRCGIRLLYEPRPEDTMNEGTIEYVTVAAVSCPPEMFHETFLGRPCWDDEWEFNYLFDRDEITLRVIGLHEFDREPRGRAGHFSIS